MSLLFLLSIHPLPQPKQCEGCALSAFQKLQMVLWTKSWVHEDRREIKTKSQDVSLAKDIKVFSLASSCPSFKWTDFFFTKELPSKGGWKTNLTYDRYVRKKKKTQKNPKLAFNIPKSSKLYYQIAKLPRLRKNLPSKWFFWLAQVWFCFNILNFTIWGCVLTLQSA